MAGPDLLGLLVSHGRSNDRAYVNGVRVIRSYVEGDVGRHIVEQLAGPMPTGGAQA